MPGPQRLNSSLQIISRGKDANWAEAGKGIIDSSSKSWGLTVSCTLLSALHGNRFIYFFQTPLGGFFYLNRKRNCRVVSHLQGLLKSDRSEIREPAFKSEQRLPTLPTAAAHQIAFHEEQKEAPWRLALSITVLSKRTWLSGGGDVHL